MADGGGAARACANGQLAAPERAGEIKNEAETTKIEARPMEAEQREACANGQLAVVRDFLFCFRTFSLCLNIWNLSLCSVGAGTGTAGSVGGDGAGRKRVFLRRSVLRMISLPR